MDLPQTTKKYYPVLALAIDLHPVAHSIEVGNKYSARTHIERLRELRRWLLNNPDRVPATVTDPTQFLSVLSDIRFAHDADTNRIFIGTRDLVSCASSPTSRHAALAGTITPELQTPTYLAAICYVIHHGLTTIPFLIKDPTPECIGTLTNLQATYPQVEILPHQDNNLLLI